MISSQQAQSQQPPIVEIHTQPWNPPSWITHKSLNSPATCTACRHKATSGLRNWWRNWQTHYLMVHLQTLTYSIPFLCLECLSTSAKCWPWMSRPPPLTWPSSPTASGTCAKRPPPPPSPRPTDPASGPRRRASAAATPTAAATPAAAAHRANAAAEPRHLTIRNSPIMAFVGTTTNIRIGQNVADNPAFGTAPMPGRETASPPARANGPSRRRLPRPSSNSHSNGDVFFAQLRFNVFERFTQPIKFLQRLRSLTQHNSLFFFPNATWPKITWSKWRQHSHLGISNKNHQNGTTQFEHVEWMG